MINKKMLNKSGFSLIELIIVIAVIGMMASIAVLSYQKYTQEAADNACLIEAQVYAQAVSVAITTHKSTLPTHSASACRQIATPAQTSNSLLAIPANTGTGITISCDLIKNGRCSKV